MQAFQLLGVSPTADVVAIKRAYAKALKRCRPDDDPQGYQRLREALEWALAWARSAAAQDTAAAPAAAEPASGPAATDNAAGELATVLPAMPTPVITQAPESDADPAQAPGPAQSTQPVDQAQPEWVDPGELARSLYQYWQDQGDAALLEAWPRLHYELDRIPLSLRHEASNWFASLVLDCPTLPVAMVAQLADYFQWGADYRSDAMLGERARPMAERLRNAGLRQAANPAVRARFAELLHLKTLIDADRHFKAIVYATFASPKNDQRLAEAPTALLQRLRMDEFDRARLKEKLNWGVAGQLLLLGMLYGALVFAVRQQDLALAILSVLFAGGAVFVVAAGNLLLQCLDVIDNGLPAKWRQAGTQPERATLSLLAAALVGLLPPFLETDTVQTLGLISACSLVALLLAWSPGYSWRGALLPIVAALFAALASLLGSNLSYPLSAALAIALFWTLAAHWAFILVPDQVLSLYRAPFKSVMPTTVGGWVYAVLFIKFIAALFAGLIFLSLPLTYLVQAVGLGTRYVVITLSLAMGAGLLFMESGQPWFFCLLAMPLVTAVLQRASGRVVKAGWFRVA